MDVVGEPQATSACTKTALETNPDDQTKKEQLAKDLSRIKIRKELNRPEKKEGTGN